MRGDDWLRIDDDEFVACAVSYAAAYGVIDPEGERFEEFERELFSLLARRRGEIIAPGDPYGRDIQQLVGFWEQERYEQWQRETLRWRCTCGRLYGVEPGWKPDYPRLWTLTDDGRFDECPTVEAYNSQRAEGMRCECGQAFYRLMRAMAAGTVAVGQTALEF